jgi:hypothetical protein
MNEERVSLKKSIGMPKKSVGSARISCAPKLFVSFLSE